MNTERPDNDDAGAEARAAGHARDTGGAPAGDEEKAAARDQEHGEREERERDEQGRQDEQGERAGREGSGTADGSAGPRDDAGEARDDDGPAAEDPAREDGAAGEPAGEAPAAAEVGEDRTGGPAGAPAADDSSAAQDGADDSGTPDGSHHPGHPDHSDGSDGSDRARSRSGARSRTPVLIASVAAAVLLVGGGGAYLATSLAGGSGSGTTPGANGDPTPPPLALDGYAEGGVPGIAPGEPNPYGATYRADGPLPEGPGSAPVYRTRGQVTQDQVVTLAKALGVEGTPVPEDGNWRIGGKDGSGPVLRVERQAPGAWTYSRNALGTDNCKGDSCTVPPVNVPPVSEEAAEKAAAPLLKALGQDEAKLDASRTVGINRTVNASPEIGGLPTHGWDTVVTVGADGAVGGAQGRLLKPVKSDTYPVVGAEEALKLMNTAPGADGRGGIGGCATPVPLEGGETPEPACEEPAMPPEDGGGRTLTVDEAVFGLAPHSVAGQPALVPSWLFEVRTPGGRETSTVTYPAVDPAYLTSASRSGEASPAPSRPGDEPTSAPAERSVHVEGYTAEGEELTVTFTGGVCADYRTTARESGGKVTVTVTEKPWPGKVCILIARQYQQTVRLDAPLGDRRVVDEDGESVPLRKDGARLPAPPEETG
ncbi:hypothetical protein ACFTXK_23885 [Streptomyces sp. NPDC056956]|uniref:hypothetical protein n=1 Tax=Streptomyces sp. NPDC056956 TaxID=3345980 RepID=UPI00362CE6F2